MTADGREDAPAPIRLEASRTMAWATFGFGWIAAQSLLTLMPIAPAWGVAALVLVGGFFVVVALTGLARVLGGGLSLDLGPGALGVAGAPIPWAEVRGWRLEQGSPRRLVVELTPEGAKRLGWRAWAALLSPRPRRLVYRAGDLRVTLTEAAGAFREVRPDLET